MAAFAAPVQVVTFLANDATTQTGTALEAWLPALVATWAAGTSLFCLRTLMGVAWVCRMRALPQPPLQAHWQQTLDALATRFGLHGVVLRLVEGLDTPVAAGWWRPVVLLPMSVALRMPAAHVEALLAHELAHVRRHDYLVNLLQRVVEALLFFHPVAWWLSRRVRIERELVADRLAAEALGDGRRLAVALAALSELPALPRPLPHVALAAHGGSLMSRIQQLISKQPVQAPTRPPVGRIALPLVGIAAACVAFLAQAQIGKDATPAVRSTAPIAQTVIHHDDKDDRGFAIVRKGDDDNGMVAGSLDDLDDIQRVKTAMGSDFLWFKQDGKAYVVDDPATIARVQALWKDSNDLGEQMSALGDKMSVHGEKMEALGKKMEKLSVHHAPTPEMDQAQEAINELAQRQLALSGKQMRLSRERRDADEKREAEIEREMETLDKQMEGLSGEMEKYGAVMEREGARLEKMQVPMEEISKQMDVETKPMEKLGKEMGALGEKQKKLVKKAEAETRVEISNAMKKGLARPAPGQRSAE
jgi:beta-lactamase regulating signal transducer with metallopeptidase domain